MFPVISLSVSLSACPSVRLCLCLSLCISPFVSVLCPLSGVDPEKRRECVYRVGRAETSSKQARSSTTTWHDMTLVPLVLSPPNKTLPSSNSDSSQDHGTAYHRRRQLLFVQCSGLRSPSKAESGHGAATNDHGGCEREPRGVQRGTYVRGGKRLPWSRLR